MPFQKYSAKQKKLAAVAGDPKKIEIKKSSHEKNDGC